jgi:plastocyanin
MSMIQFIPHLLAASLAFGTPRPTTPVVTIHAKDFAFSGPKTVKASGPITFRLINDGKELHHVTIVKLAKGKTMKDVAEAMKKKGPPPSWMTDVGGPNPAVPGGTAEATLNLEPGEYALFCFIPSPGSAMPHMAKGMVSSITVEADAAAGPQQAGAPVADVTMNASDYKFDLSKPLTAGKHMINFVNNAQQSHEVVVVELAPGKTAADVSKWLDKDMMKGPPPGKTVGGMAAMAKGRSGMFPLDLKAGNYALLCFVPDAKDGKPHNMHGMVQQVVVK